MKHHFLRTFLILLLVAALGAGGVYAVARYGSQEDPLIAKSYLIDVVEKEITDRTDEQIRAAVSDAQGRVQEQIRAAAGVFQSVRNASLGLPANTMILVKLNVFFKRLCEENVV